MALCLFPLYTEPMGPFPCGQWSAFIPPALYEPVSRFFYSYFLSRSSLIIFRWLVQRRGALAL